jgi:hypothetical protein
VGVAQPESSRLAKIKILKAEKTSLRIFSPFGSYNLQNIEGRAISISVQINTSFGKDEDR